MRVIAYLCRACGNRFKTSVADDEEVREAIRRGRGATPARCPKCGSTNLQHDE